MLTFLSSNIAAKQKIRELEVTYRQKLDETTLTNARLHIETLYLPLSIEISKLVLLNNKFFPTSSDYDDNSDEKEVFAEDMRKGCLEFSNFCHNLFLNGMNMYGTAPLNGERAQRDFPRPPSWTLGHVGIRQRPGTGTPSWTLWQGGPCCRLPPGPSSSLRLDPGNRSDLVA